MERGAWARMVEAGTGGANGRQAILRWASGAGSLDPKLMEELMAIEEELLPAPENDDFIDFLCWLNDEQSYDGRQIIAVIEKPWQYLDEYRAYHEAGGTDR